jgi:hypothetical protein
MSAIFLLRHASPFSLRVTAESVVLKEDEYGLSECGVHEARTLGPHFSSMSTRGG